MNFCAKAKISLFTGAFSRVSYLLNGNWRGERAGVVAAPRNCADSVAQRYLGDCQSWSPDEIVSEFERAGYELARQGKTVEASAVFIAVADMTNRAITVGTQVTKGIFGAR